MGLLFKIAGWRAPLLHDDHCAYDRWVWMAQHLKKGNQRMLDAGCGSGTFSLYAALQGNNVVGISFDEKSNRSAMGLARDLKINNVQFVTADLRTLSVNATSLGLFDQIICFETIEHILNDQKLIKDLSSLLKEGGTLLLTTPYKHYKRLYGEHKLSDYEDGGHVRWGYEHEEMKEIFENAGLTVTRQDFVSGFFSQKSTNLLRILGKKSPRLAWAVTLPLRLLRPLDKLITRALKYPFLSIAVIGTKQQKS